MRGSLSGPERVWFRKAKRTETTTTTSRDSRKTTKKTSWSQQILLDTGESGLISELNVPGTANRLTVMIAVCSIKNDLIMGFYHAGEGERAGKVTALGGHGGNIWLAMPSRKWGGGRI